MVNYMLLVGKLHAHTRDTDKAAVSQTLISVDSQYKICIVGHQ